MSIINQHRERLESFLGVEHLEQYCASDLLSLEGLHHHVTQITSHDQFLQRSSFLHLACENKKTSLDIVEFLLSWCPDAATSQSRLFHPVTSPFLTIEATTALPLHLACVNDKCPSSVIALLINKHALAVRQGSTLDGINYYKNSTDEIVSFKGLPLHFYLSRQSSIEIGTIQLLVDAYPESLIYADEYDKCTPFHLFLSNKEYLANTEYIDQQAIVRYIIDAEPALLRTADADGELPIHTACGSGLNNVDVMQLLLRAWPEAVTHQNMYGSLPVHTICVDPDFTNVDFLRKLVTLYPESVRLEGERSELPIHLAAATNKVAYVKMLLEAFPESLSVQNEEGDVLIHLACLCGCLEVVQFLCELNPEAIYERSRDGCLSIHFTCNSEPQPEIIQYLLLKDPTLAAQTPSINGRLFMPLHMVCSRLPDSKAVKAVKLLFDAYPEAIYTTSSYQVGFQGRWVNGTPLIAARDFLDYFGRDLGNETASIEVVSFLETQQVYADRAVDVRIMTTLDKHGWLPLHHALHENASLGAIKLLLKANPSALRVTTYQEAYPLHIACKFSAPDIVQYLVESGAGRSLNSCDINGDSPLHYACRGGNYEVLKYLIEVSAKSVSERNRNGELPIHSICGHKQEDNPESSEYVETIWRLLLAYPEAVMG